MEKARAEALAEAEETLRAKFEEEMRSRPGGSWFMSGQYMAGDGVAVSLIKGLPTLKRVRQRADAVVEAVKDAQQRTGAELKEFNDWFEEQRRMLVIGVRGAGQAWTRTLKQTKGDPSDLQDLQHELEEARRTSASAMAASASSESLFLRARADGRRLNSLLSNWRDTLFSLYPVLRGTASTAEKAGAELDPRLWERGGEVMRSPNLDVRAEAEESVKEAQLRAAHPAATAPGPQLTQLQVQSGRLVIQALLHGPLSRAARGWGKSDIRLESIEDGEEEVSEAGEEAVEEIGEETGKATGRESAEANAMMSTNQDDLSLLAESLVEAARGQQPPEAVLPVEGLRRVEFLLGALARFAYSSLVRVGVEGSGLDDEEYDAALRVLERLLIGDVAGALAALEELLTSMGLANDLVPSRPATSSKHSEANEGKLFSSVSRVVSSSTTPLGSEGDRGQGFDWSTVTSALDAVARFFHKEAKEDSWRLKKIIFASVCVYYPLFSLLATVVTS